MTLCQINVRDYECERDGPSRGARVRQRDEGLNLFVRQRFEKIIEGVCCSGRSVASINEPAATERLEATDVDSSLLNIPFIVNTVYLNNNKYKHIAKMHLNL